MLKEEIKEGVVGRGRLAKSVEMRGEALGFKEELGNKRSSHRKWLRRL